MDTLTHTQTAETPAPPAEAQPTQAELDAQDRAAGYDCRLERQEPEGENE